MQPIDVSAVPYDSWYGRVLRLPIKLIPAGTALPILQGPLKGKRWIVSSSVQSCWLGNYEFDKCVLFERRIREGGVVFDIGAQAGYHTILAARLVGASGAVFAFEPAPRNVRYLREHVAMHRLRNVVVVEAAVSDLSGSAFFDGGSNSLSGRLSDHGAIPVRCVGIDEEVSSGQLPAPDYLKIDVEGAEMNLLRGARRTLSQGHPEIFLDTHSFLGGEFSPLHSECCRFLLELGYRIEPIGSTNIEDASQVHAWVERAPVSRPS